MTTPEPQPAAPPPSPPFQFTLRTLLLLFVVLGSSLDVFGAWGILVFAVVVGLAILVHQAESYAPLRYLILTVIGLALVILLMPRFSPNAIERAGYRTAHCGVKLKCIAEALQQYHKDHGSYPPAYIADKTGKPMHSCARSCCLISNTAPCTGPTT